jgi:ABC-type branched-subunit amino acid transport system substrate-binding protein
LSGGCPGLHSESDPACAAAPVRRSRWPHVLFFLILAVLLSTSARGEDPPPLMGPSSETVPVERPYGNADAVGGPEKGSVPLLSLWQAEREFRSGDAARALTMFLDLAYNYSDDERKGFVWMRVAELLLARQELKQALDAADKAIVLSRARFLALASMDLKFRIYQRLGWGKEARQFAAYLLEQGYINAEASDLLSEMARADGQDGNISLALSEYRRAIAASAATDPVTVLRLRRERDTLIQGLTNILTIRKAAESEEDAGVRGLLYLRMGRVAIRKGFTGMGAFALEKASLGGETTGKEAARELSWLRRMVHYRPKIVGLVPLSGKYADIGFALLTGAEMAIRQSQGKEAEILSPVLIWTDTGGQPERARAGFQAAFRDESVVGFIGPLTGEEGQSVSVSFDGESPPVLYLGQKSIPWKPFLYSFGLTPRQEALAVLTHLAKAGQDDLLLFYPDNGYGRGFADAVITSAWEARVRVTKRVSYSPDTTDFSNVIRQAVGSAAFSRESSRKKGEAVDLPQKAVVIADRWERVFLLASQLRYYSVYLPLAGFSGWNDERLLQKAGDAVDGAVFSVDYARSVPGFLGKNFQKEYQDVLEHAPSRFEAVGYDAALLLAESFRLGEEGDSRPAAVLARERIPLLRTFRGLTGTFQFGPEGEMRRKVFLLVVELGKFVPVPDS